MNFAPLALGVAITLGCTLSVLPAQALDEEERQQARDFVYQGDQWFNQGRFGEALDAYRNADEIMGVPTTRIEVAKTLSVLGRLSDARATAVEVEKMPVSPGEPLPFAEARVRAGVMVRDLDRRIPSVTLQLSQAVKTRTILVDGERVPDELAFSPIAMDPGRHIITVRAPGYVEVSKSVELQEGGRAVLDVVLEPKTASASAFAISAFVASGLFLTTAIVTGAIVATQADTLEDPAPMQWVSNISYVLAAAAGITGGIVLGIDLSRQPERRVTAHIGAGFIGLVAEL